MTPHTSRSKERKHKVGDTVCFEQCWEDESGAYYDESAEILEIRKDGTLRLSWIGVSDEVLKFLNDFTYTLDDISD